MLDMQTCFLSEMGGRSRNEDACGYWTSDDGCCWVVSDGAGGHGSGDVASRLVVSTVLARTRSPSTRFGLLAESDALHPSVSQHAVTVRV